MNEIWWFVIINDVIICYIVVMSVRYEDFVNRFCCWYIINRKVKGNIKDNFYLLV